MSSFRVCQSCGRGHDKPEILNDLIDHYRVTCKCGHILPQYMSEKEWLIDLSDKIDRLEKLLGVVKL